MIEKNVTFQNVTYDAEWFNTHNLTHNNPNASLKAFERKQKVENYSLSLNSSVEAVDQIYKTY